MSRWTRRIGGLLEVAGYAFISYSRVDSEYVMGVAAYLEEKGVEVWLDRELKFGDSWVPIIQDRIDQSAAFVVIMTEAAEASVWVRRETTRAQQKRRPILVLLLSGTPPIHINDIQIHRVRGGLMPSEEFVTQLRLLTGIPSEEAEAEGELRDASRPTIQAPPSLAPAAFERVLRDLRRRFFPNRFGIGYDIATVDRLFDGVIDAFYGRSGRPIKEFDLSPGWIPTVRGGYSRSEVDVALREVRELIAFYGADG